MTKEIHDLLISRKEGKILVKIFREGLDSLDKDERKRYAGLIDRIENVTTR